MTIPGTASGRVKEISQFVENRQGMWPSIATDLYTGEDFFGNKITNTLSHVAQQIVPIGAGETWRAWEEGQRGEEFWDKLNGLPGGQVAGDVAGNIQRNVQDAEFMTSSLTGFMGMNFLPIRPTDNRQDQITRAGEWRESGLAFVDSQGNVLTEWRELTGDQQKEWREFDSSPKGNGIQEEIDRDADRKDSVFNDLRAVDKAAEFALEQAGQALIQEGAVIGSREQYRTRVAGIRAVERMAREILRNKEGIEDSEPITVDQKIIEGYFEEVVDNSLDPEFREALKAQVEAGSISETILSAALQIDPEIFEANERAYFAFVLGTYGEAGLEKLKTVLKLSDSTDAVLSEYGADKDMLNEGYYKTRDSLFTPVILEAHGLPGAIADQYLSWEQFKNETLISMSLDLEGRILPVEIGEIENRSGETIYERFQIHPTQEVNQAQAEAVARIIGEDVFKGYEGFRTEVSNQYLIANPDQLCALSYWEYRESVNDALKPYLSTCSSRVPQPANYP